MMNWITPLGFLGLIGIAVLILIYILKPNYQQKFISSTFIWKLSLKYKRKKVPINKFRNILLFICQILIITACAFILAQPIIEEATAPIIVEKVAIIDASANMRASYAEETRFERAVFETETLAREVFEEEGFITVIIAGYEADYLAQRYTAENSLELFTALDELVTDDLCTYGTGDIKGAIEKAQKIVDQNVDTEVYLFTATEYLDEGEVTVVDVSQNGEWNAAILNCEALFEENYYTFKVSVAAYNRDTDLMVHCDVQGANGAGTVKMELPVRCDADQTKTATFVTQNTSTPVFEFESVHVYISEDDSFPQDNDFHIYGGKKPTLNVLYCSPKANSFIGGTLLTARDTLTDWNIELKEMNKPAGKEEVPTSGYDFYVFEHTMPDVMPTDGVVMLINMDKAPEGLTMVPGQLINGEFTLAAGEGHPITNRFNAEKIEVSQYTRILSYDGFKPLLFCAGDPVLLVKEDEGQKIMVMNFSVNFSMVSMYVEFPILIYNIFDYFMPSTLQSHAFDINEEIVLNARADELNIQSTNGKYKDKFNEFPTTLTLTQPGSYTVTQTPLSGEVVTEQFFVKIPASESNISRVEDQLEELIIPKKKDMDNLDLLLYLAAALVALVIFERWLQAQDS